MNTEDGQTAVKDLATASDWSRLIESRCAQLQKLTREHRECISFAEEIAGIAERGSDAELAEGIEKVQEYNDRELEAHLQHEEQRVFAPIIQQYRDHMDLCIKLAREHGVIRTLVEEMTPETARKDLADFALILKRHTLEEERELFPLVESVFTPEQLAAVVDFTPLLRHKAPVQPPAPNAGKDQHEDREWLSAIRQHFDHHAMAGGSIVLFPRYRPELCMELAQHLDLEFFDYQKEVMEDLGLEAESIDLDQLAVSLRAKAEKTGIVSHNVEALLCVKPESERRAWLRSFLEANWPNPIVLPITVFQQDVPQDHQRVCDLELHKMPR